MIGKLRIVHVTVDEARGDQCIGVLRDGRARGQARQHRPRGPAVDDAAAVHDDDRVGLVNARRFDAVDEGIAAKRDEGGA